MLATNILIIEDDPAITEILGDLLRSEGYAVASATDGLAGLAALQAATPDLLLLDVMMPLLDGPSMLRRAAAEGIALPPVLLMTAGRPPDIDDLPIGAFVPKPFDVDQVLGEVARLIGRGRSHAS
jgi:DNA-binding response OmpR family regulator